MKTSPPPVRISVAARLRDEIEKAEAEGAARDEMMLHLTNSDVLQLQRDRSLALSDISFADGQMVYLGVKVTRGGIAESVLLRPEG